MSTITSAPRTPADVRHRPSLATLLRAEVTDEIKLIYREPAALFFSVLMPVMFFALFSAMFGGFEAEVGGVPTGTSMLATFGGYGVIVATMLTPAIGLAESRERGWLDVVKVSPVPVPVSLAARMIATVPYCIGILTAMTATAAALGVLQITLGQWLALLFILIPGSLPFALIGLAIGARASGNATTAILNAIIIPLAIAGGLWFPLDQMPDWITGLAPALPTYHLSQLALAPLDGSAWAGHVVYLLGFTVVAGIIATMTYRRSAQ
ncbi:ABC transporter permease [soil metagenome]